MNLMFRKNFDKSGGGGGDGGPPRTTILGGSSVVGGSSAGGNLGGGYSMGGGPLLGNTMMRRPAAYQLDHDQYPSSTGGGYRTHLLFGPHAGAGGQQEEGYGFGPNPRRTSGAGPHMIKWGGGGQQGQQAQPPPRQRKASKQQQATSPGSGAEDSASLTPTTAASRQVRLCVFIESAVILLSFVNSRTKRVFEIFTV